MAIFRTRSAAHRQDRSRDSRPSAVAIRLCGAPPLRRAGGPKAGHAVKDGQDAPAGFLGLRAGDVTVHVDEERRAVVNKTKPNHLYHDGFVQRLVVEGNTVFVRHYGEGMNTSLELQPPGAPSGRWPPYGVP